jgi:dihydroorotase-like cyclic amidohydrolase
VHRIVRRAACGDEDVVGADADVTIIDPEARWTIDPKQFRSKSRNTSFAGWKLRGRPIATIRAHKLHSHRDLW